MSEYRGLVASARPESISFALALELIACTVQLVTALAIDFTASSPGGVPSDPVVNARLVTLVSFLAILIQVWTLAGAFFGSRLAWAISLGLNVLECVAALVLSEIPLICAVLTLGATIFLVSTSARRFYRISTLLRQSGRDRSAEASQQ